VDAGIRELERRWAITRAPDDEGRLLAARVRAGELRAESIQLAACAGHAGAAAAAEVLEVQAELDLVHAAAEAWPFSLEARLRVALAALLALLPAWDATESPAEVRSLPRDAARLVASILRAHEAGPREGDQEELRRLGEIASDLTNGGQLTPEWSDGWSASGVATLQATFFLLGALQAEGPASEQLVQEDVGACLGSVLEGGPAVGEALRRKLLETIPGWALGYDDPLIGDPDCGRG